MSTCVHREGCADHHRCKAADRCLALRKDADVDRLTETQIEAWRTIWKNSYRDHAWNVPEYKRAFEQLDEICDLALQSLSQEAVRDEVLGEFSIHYDFDLERITLAMVEAVDDEYAHNEKLRIAYAHDAEYRRRTIAAIHQRLLKGWIDLVIKPLLTKYHRHFQSMQRIVERETLLEKDAARYRWLRDTMPMTIGSALKWPYYPAQHDYDVFDAKIDAAIDTALKDRA